jgi:hypothetical protein
MTHIVCEMTIHELLRVAASYDKDEIHLSPQQLDQLLHDLHARASRQLVNGAELIFGTVTVIKCVDNATAIHLRSKAFSHKRRVNRDAPFLPAGASVGMALAAGAA